MSIISAGDTGAADLPEISNSLRFDGSNDYLTRSYTNTTFTQAALSIWVERSKLGANQAIFGFGAAGTGYPGLYVSFNASDQLSIAYDDSVNPIGPYTTSAVFRDPSAWYHIVIVWDTTQATQIDRQKVWVNGVFQTTTNGLSLNATLYLRGTPDTATFGRRPYSGDYYFDGYIANPCVVFGSGLTASSFAYTDPNGQWRSLSKTALQAVVNAGGTASFFLPFDNGTSTTTLGNDASSKGNNWTLTNMVRDGSVNDCWTLDSPTNNFATLSWVDNGCQILNGALSWYSSGAAWQGCRATQAVPASKVIWEVIIGSGYTQIAVGPRTASLGLGTGDTGVYRWDASGGVITHSGVTQTTITLAVNDVVGVAVDGVAGTVALYKNGALAYTFSQTFSGDVYPSVWMYQTTQSHINFGQRPVASGQWYPDAGGYFRYAPPTGYKALNTKNLPVPTGAAVTPNEHFQTKLDTGADIKSTCETVFPSNFMEWIKDRAVSNNNQLVDIVRGTSAVLQSNTTAAETTYSTPSGSCVGWVWKAGGAPTTDNIAGAGNVPTAGSVKIDGANLGSALAGSIAATRLSANTAAGFSIVTYTGTGANATVGHGLGVEPKMVIVKQRTPSGTSWTIWNKTVFDTSAAGVLYLESNVGYTNVASAFNSTAPTSAVFSVGSGGGSSATNISTNTYVAYCFAEVPGFSKIGSYTGNGSTTGDGPFVWCGFRPRFVMLKNSSTTGTNWYIYDSARDTYNQMGVELYPNSTSAEASRVALDFTANGFKIRSTAAGWDNNASGNTIIFMAFAEAPFKYANAR